MHLLITMNAGEKHRYYYDELSSEYYVTESSIKMLAEP